jgi:hypothetical protein
MLCLIIILSRIINTVSLLFFYSKQKFLDRYILILRPNTNHHQTYFSFCFLFLEHNYHFQTISIIHRFQKDPLHPHNRSNHLLHLSNNFLYFYYCCLFLFINYLFYRYFSKMHFYFFRLEHKYYFDRKSHQTHQIH